MKKIFRKLHLWLSVPFGIFITLICFSGSMLIFEKEITEMCRHDLYFVSEVKERALPVDSVMDIVAATLPDSVSITGVTMSPDPERAWQVGLSNPRRASLYVDQYTGEVKGRSERLPFYDVMFHLHRWMLGSSKGFGKLLVGVSTLLLVVILLTGILMWLSNRKKPLHKSLTISFTRGFPRFWHDLHVAGGIYATVFLLALALTGLTWSFSWYRTGFYAMFGVEAAASGHGGHGSHERHEDGYGAHRHKRGGKGHEHGYGKSRHDDMEASAKKTEHASTAISKKHDVVSVETEKDITDASMATGRQADSEPQVSGEDKARHYHSEDGDGENSHGYHGGRGRRHHHNNDSLGGYYGHHGGDSLHRRGRHRHSQDATGQDDSNGVMAGVAGDNTHRKTERVASGMTARRGSGRKGRNMKYNSGKQVGNRVKTASDSVTELSCDTLACMAGLPEVSPFANWQNVYEQLVKAYPDYRQITLSDGSAGVVPAGRSSLRATDKFDFDPATGKITGSLPYSAQDKSAKVRSTVYTVHVGSWGGWLTRIITFIAALLGATLPLTGYYLWIRKMMIKRKNKRQQSAD